MTYLRVLTPGPKIIGVSMYTILILALLFLLIYLVHEVPQTMLLFIVIAIAMLIKDKRRR